METAVDVEVNVHTHRYIDIGVFACVRVLRKGDEGRKEGKKEGRQRVAVKLNAGAVVS